MQSFPRRRAPRFRVPMFFVLLGTLAILCLLLSERIESYVAAYLVPAVCVMTTASILIWFMRSAQFSRQTKKKGVFLFICVVVLVTAALLLLTRREGVVTGVGFPRLVWRWSPKPGERLPPLRVMSQHVDLATTTPEDFPEFLGPHRRNTIWNASLSHDWTTKPPRLLWRQPIGLGWCSFAIVGNWAVTQEQRGDDEMVVCYELRTGKPAWAHTRPHERFHDVQGGDGPRATPTIVAGRVYAMGATGILDCLDGATGKLIWSRNVLAGSSGNLLYGKSCSPLVVDGVVYVTGGKGGPSLLAYYASDGSPDWSAGAETPGYASPIITLPTLADRRQILTVNVASVTAHDPATGALLWRFDWPGSMPKNIQPVQIDGNRVLLSAGYGLGTVMLNIQSQAGKLAATPLWESRRLKPKHTNDVVILNDVYGLDDGVLTCLDVTTGKRMWRGDSYGFGQLLGVNDHLLIEAESGDVALVKADPGSFHEVSRFQALNQRTWSGPALSGHYLLVRNDQEAACFELP